MNTQAWNNECNTFEGTRWKENITAISASHCATAKRAVKAF